jgi:peptide/nickel transport system substrate-binding protein
MIPRLNLNSSLLLSLLAALLIVSSCNLDTPQDDGTAKESVVNARLPAEPDRLNPLLATSTYSRVVNELVFLSLLQYDPQTLATQPQLAKAKPVVEELEEGPYAGGVSYTYELHEEATWDNGSPITGHDFVFTLKVLLNPKVAAAHIRPYLEFIKDVEVDERNPKRFTVFVDKKYILNEAVINSVQLIPEYAYDADQLMSGFELSQLTNPEQAAKLAEENEALQAFADAFNSPEMSREKGNVIGSGAYSFERWETGQEIVLLKKEDWWGDKLSGDFPMLQANPDKIVLKIIPDQTASLAALKDGQVDVIAQIDAQDFADLKKNEMVQQQFNLHAPPSFIYYYVGMNNQDPKLADKRVRRALAHLVDVDQLVESQFDGLAQRTIGPFHPTKAYYHKDLKPIEFSPEKAKALLTEAGWEDTDGNGILEKNINGVNTPLKINFKYSSASKFSEKQAVLFKDKARLAGVDVNLIPLEFTVLIQDTKKRDYEMYSSAWGQDPTVDDPKQLWHSESDTPSGGNRVSFINAKADSLIDAIRVTLDEQQRQELYLEFQELIYEEQPYIFLFSPFQRIAISKGFKAMASARRPGFFVNEFVSADVAPQ